MNFREKERCKELLQFYKNTQDACIIDLLKSKGFSQKDIAFDVISALKVRDKNQINKIIAILEQKKDLLKIEEGNKIKLKEKNTFTAVTLSPIQVLIQMPKFNSWVDLIRETYKINPNSNNKFLLHKIFKNKENHFIVLVNLYLAGLYSEETDNKYKHLFDEIKRYAKALDECEKKHYPKMDAEIINFRRTIATFPRSFNRAIKSYVLYGHRIGALNMFLKKTKPQLDIDFANTDFEPFINLKIYIDTDKKEIEKMIDKALIMQKALKKIFGVSSFFSKKPEVFAKDLLWYVLRMKATPKEANAALIELGFEEVDYKKNDYKIKKKFEKTFLK